MCQTLTVTLTLLTPPNPNIPNQNSKPYIHTAVDLHASQLQYCVSTFSVSLAVCQYLAWHNLHFIHILSEIATYAGIAKTRRDAGTVPGRLDTGN